MKEEINKKLKEAMRSKDSSTLLTLRSILAAFTNWEKANPGKKIEEVAIINTLAKQRKQSIDEYKKANNVELAIAEELELKILESFLPKQLSESEVDVILKEIFDAVKPSNMKDMGIIMKKFNEKYSGQYDNKKLSEKIKSSLI